MKDLDPAVIVFLIAVGLIFGSFLRSMFDERRISSTEAQRDQALEIARIIAGGDLDVNQVSNAGVIRAARVQSERRTLRRITAELKDVGLYGAAEVVEKIRLVEDHR